MAVAVWTWLSGLVYVGREKSPAKTEVALKKFKPSKEGEGVSPTAIRGMTPPCCCARCCHVVCILGVPLLLFDRAYGCTCCKKCGR